MPPNLRHLRCVIPSREIRHEIGILRVLGGVPLRREIPFAFRKKHREIVGLIDRIPGVLRPKKAALIADRDARSIPDPESRECVCAKLLMAVDDVLRVLIGIEDRDPRERDCLRVVSVTMARDVIVAAYFVGDGLVSVVVSVCDDERLRSCKPDRARISLLVSSGEDFRERDHKSRVGCLPPFAKHRLPEVLENLELVPPLICDRRLLDDASRIVEEDRPGVARSPDRVIIDRFDL